MTKMRRVAVVGLGSIGRRHCENLCRLGLAPPVIVRRPGSPNPAFVPPEDSAVVHSNAEALAAGVDLAIVCNPTSLHVGTALEYVEAGIPVVVEKPLAHSLAAGQRLAEAAQRRGVRVVVAYCMRYHPAYALARRLLSEGAVGPVAYAKAWFESYLPAWHPWEDYRRSYAARRDLGGGALRTLDHEIDFLNWCLGRPHRVAGHAGRSGVLEIDADDHAALRLHYPHGITAGVELSLCRRDYARGFEFVGSQATLRFAFDRGRLELAGTGEPQLLWESRGYDLNQMYVDLLTQVLDDLDTGNSHSPAIDDGLATLAVAEAVAPYSDHA